jgi:predicted dehydrogenase
MAAKHAAIVNADPSACLMLVVDRHLGRARWLGDQFGAASSSDLDEAMAADAVIVATSTPSHRDAALRFIAAGVPVLVEKPLSATLADAQEMVATAHHVDGVLMCGFVERFNPQLGPIVEHARRGITAFEMIRVGRPVGPAQSSVIDDVLIHDLDLVLRLVGQRDLSEVTASADDWVDGAPWPETARCELRFADGTTASMLASRVAAFHERSFVATNVAGTRRVDLDRPGGNPLAEQLKHFAHLVKRGGAEERLAERRGILPAHELADQLGALIGDLSWAT